MTSAPPPVVDIHVTNHGSIWMFQPFTPAADDWIEANISPDALWYAGALAVESRYGLAIVEGMRADGLAVEESKAHD